ncbi:MAG TPA: endonuclease/exonuclease/phosphatase family protein [Gemmatimonadales bacterium]|nr:endonuclease/exonuclease/phosphatase family protein [Gemmatimonadales bacterium]
MTSSERPTGSAASVPAPPAIPVLPWGGPDGRDRLQAWRANVGAPVALDLAETPPLSTVAGVAVVSWNCWIGHGRLADVIGRVRETTTLPIVALVQEAYRADGSIPERPAARAARRAAGGFGARRSDRADIVQTARALGLNLRYAPSMRNGAAPSDRGNAILSDLPLTDAHAFELPLVLQRRVPVVATLSAPHGGLTVASAHLDPRGPPGYAWLGVAGRAKQTDYLLRQLGDDVVILGADLNLGRGRRERSWRLLQEAGFSHGIPGVRPTWRHTFHALPRLVLDYVLVRDRQGRVARAAVERLDEHPLDRGRTVFGSDHHPLLARIDLHP